MIMNGLARVAAVAIAISGLAFGTATAFAAPQFVNGGFETDQWDPGSVYQVTPSGWNAVQSDDDRFVMGNHNTADTSEYYTPYGNQFIVLCGGDCYPGVLGNVSQVVSGFTVGAQYTLSFAHSPEWSGEDDLVEVTIAGAGTLSKVFSSAGVGGYWSEWTTQSWTFTADSPTLTFTFAGAVADGNSSDDNWESGIDNISLTEATSTSVSIPTLGVWGMILLAIMLALGAGFTLRRRYH